MPLTPKMSSREVGLLAPLLVFVCSLLALVGAEVKQLPLGDDQVVSVCRENNATLHWPPPENVTLPDKFMSLSHRPDEVDKPQYTFASKSENEKWQLSGTVTRYFGRFSNSSLTTFHLESVIKSDAGMYILEIETYGEEPVTYTGNIDLVVYHEDNLFPRLTQAENTTEESGYVQYTYLFERPEDCPAIGMRMTPSGGDRVFECDFAGSSSCEIVIDTKDFGEYTGNIELEVDRIFPGRNPCEKVVNAYYIINIVVVKPTEATLSRGIITLLALVIAVLIAVVIAAPLIKKYKKNQKKKVSLSKGLPFVKYCIRKISAVDNWRDLGGVYREPKPNSQVVTFIELFQGLGEEKFDNEYEDYRTERVLMAAAVKLFLRDEKSAWFPLELQRDVLDGGGKYITDNGLNVQALKRALNEDATKEGVLRRDILQALMVHFKWLADYQANLPPHSNVVDCEGLARCVSPNLFKEVDKEYLDALTGSPLERSQMANIYSDRYTLFTVKLIAQHAEVFARQRSGPAEPNDDTTHQLLTESVSV